MIFQDPMSSLNPVITIGRQVTEVLERHRGMSTGEAKAEAEQILRRVGIPDPAAGSGSTRTSCPAACASGRSSPWRWPASPGC